MGQVYVFMLPVSTCAVCGRWIYLELLVSLPFTLVRCLAPFVSFALKRCDYLVVYVLITTTGVYPGPKNTDFN